MGNEIDVSPDDLPSAPEEAAPDERPDPATEPRALEPAAIGAWQGLLEAHSVVVAEAERQLRAADLPPLGWYDALHALHEAPDRRLRHHELADLVLLSRSGLSRLVDRMEADGAIARRPASDDRRGADVVLTERGLDLLRRMWPVYSRVIEERFARPLGVYAAGVRDALDAVARTGRLAG